MRAHPSGWWYVLGAGGYSVCCHQDPAVAHRCAERREARDAVEADYLARQ